MSNKSGFQWVISPEDELIPNIEDFAVRIEVVVRKVAIYWGQHIQDQARLKVDSEHKWDTRTGAAQGGLFFAVDGLGLGEVSGEIDSKALALMSDVGIVQGDKETLIITLGHTVYYGKYLELSNGGVHAVIMSTIEENIPMLERLLNDAGSGVFSV